MLQIDSYKFLDWFDKEILVLSRHWFQKPEAGNFMYRNYAAVFFSALPRSGHSFYNIFSSIVKYEIGILSEILDIKLQIDSYSTIEWYLEIYKFL